LSKCQYHCAIANSGKAYKSEQNLLQKGHRFSINYLSHSKIITIPYEALGGQYRETKEQVQPLTESSITERPAATHE
jgi:hypothetical protein